MSQRPAGAISRIVKGLFSSNPEAKPELAPDGSYEGVHGFRVRPTKPIGQRAAENPPDSAPVAEKLKSWRDK